MEPRMDNLAWIWIRKYSRLYLQVWGMWWQLSQTPCCRSHFLFLLLLLAQFCRNSAQVCLSSTLQEWEAQGFLKHWSSFQRQWYGAKNIKFLCTLWLKIPKKKNLKLFKNPYFYISVVYLQLESHFKFKRPHCHICCSVVQVHRVLAHLHQSLGNWGKSDMRSFV